MKNLITNTVHTVSLDTNIACSITTHDRGNQPPVLSQQHYSLTQNCHDMSSNTKVQKDSKTDIYERANNRIIALLEEGKVAWRRSWSSYGFAKNFVTDYVYTGINFLFMNQLSPYPIPYYLTFKQAKELGGNIKKGEKAEYIYFYKGYYKDEQGNNISDKQAQSEQYANIPLTPVRFLKCYPVFNIEQTEGIEWEKPELVNRANEPIEAVQNIVRNIDPQPVFKYEDSNRAYYHPIQDYINMPKLEQFENSELNARTTFHEIVHWTGHEKRLAREGIVTPSSFGTKRYAEEELVAEMGANYLLNIAGITSDDTMNVSAGYLKNWIECLKENPRFIFKVAPKAQQAVEFIIGKPISETV